MVPPYQKRGNRPPPGGPVCLQNVLQIFCTLGSTWPSARSTRWGISRNPIFTGQKQSHRRLVGSVENGAVLVLLFRAVQRQRERQGKVSRSGLIKRSGGGQASRSNGRPVLCALRPG